MAAIILDIDKSILGQMGFSVSALLVVSGAYICAFALTAGLITPLQQATLPGVSHFVSLMFLPHGVRVLAFFFFGWRGLVYLLPGSLAMWALSATSDHLDELHVAGTAISLLSCYIGVVLTTHFLSSASSGRLFSWPQIMVAGTIGSVANAAGLSALHHSTPSMTLFLAYIMGDVLGLFVLLFALMFVFRAAEGLIRKWPR